jgi:hypothetical protein
MFKFSGRTSQETHCRSIEELTVLRLLAEKTAVYSEKHIEDKYSVGKM